MRRADGSIFLTALHSPADIEVTQEREAHATISGRLERESADNIKTGNFNLRVR